MQPSSAASSGFGYFYANHFYPELMNNGLIAEVQTKIIGRIIFMISN